MKEIFSNVAQGRNYD